MNRKRNLRGPRPQGQPPQPQPRSPNAGYGWYHRRCPYWWYNDYDYDWYDYDDYAYDDYGYDEYDNSDYYAYDEDYLGAATQKAFKAGVKMGMQRAKMMWNKPEPEPTPPEPPMVTKKGE